MIAFLVILTIIGLLGITIVQESEIAEWKRAAAFWQQQAGENVDKAVKWDLHLADCARGGRTRAAAERAPIRATMRQMRREMGR